MAEIQRIDITRQHTQKVFEIHRASTNKELMSVLGDDHEVVPEDQVQAEGSVDFHDSTIAQAKHELLQKGEQAKVIQMNHHHMRKYNHGFAFSEADLSTAKHLYETQQIDRMGLVMNGEELSDGSMVQHKITANHAGELHDLHGEGGEVGKVVTMYTNQQGQEKMIFSASIQEAEQKEALIVALKEKLFAEPTLQETIDIDGIIEQAA